MQVAFCGQEVIQFKTRRLGLVVEWGYPMMDTIEGDTKTKDQSQKQGAEAENFDGSLRKFEIHDSSDWMNG
ncbi:MAG: hypothetical protein LR011_01335 [Verrucomicrobia bacterium]|nr:hypothetical protein [Verrucomicrobiota bacterium]